MSTDRTNTIEDIASHWLVRRDSGKWTAADERRLQDWLAASTLHRVTFLRLEWAWSEAGRLKALAAGRPADLPPSRGRWNLTSFFDVRNARVRTGPVTLFSRTWLRTTLERRGGHRLLGVAACLVLSVVVGGYLAHGLLGPRSGHFETPIGGIEQIPLADGSSITLNTNSEARVAFSDNERLVELKRGEAFFQVAHDPKRPFVVAVDGRRVIAVGTRFSVRREAQDVGVVVTEGTVRVEDVGTTFLPAGSIASASDAGVLVKHESVVAAGERLAWRSGVLMFRDQTLADVVAEFNRYNSTQLVISDPRVAAIRIEGNFRATRVESFVRLLEAGFPLRAVRVRGEILLVAN